VSSQSNERNTAGRKFLHVLRFKCPKCSETVNAARSTEYMSREQAARLIFEPVCKCGWSGKLAGFAALRHSVQFG
jgi:predicted RNA-binding Zn-ribbon protein involved in translation (DUF1610 family)